MNTEGIIRASELVITLLPYRDEFVLIDEIWHTAQDNMYGKEFKELGYDFDQRQNQGVTTSADWITQQLVNGNIVKHTRSIFDNYGNLTADYYVLTKIGRKMKGENGLRTFKQLKEWKEKKRRDKHHNKSLQAALLRSQIATNRISKTTNISIAIFTLVAAIYYGFEFCKDFIPQSNPHKQEIEFWVSVSLAGLGLSLVLRTVIRKRE